MSVPAERLSDMMTLRDLLEGLADAPAIPVSGIGDDSRRLMPGDVFIATQGGAHHGLDFVGAAEAAGVAAVVWDADTGDAELATGAVPFVAVPGLAARIGDIANRWFGEPSSDLGVIGVTGTNGKTTVAWLVAQSLKLLGRDCGYVGTLGYGLDALDVDLGLTTPPCIDLQSKLAGFRDQGAAHAAIEVSSHALAQGRLSGTRFETAIFTNLSRDHIDYHGDMRAYGEAKASLFTDYRCDRRIVSLDTDFGFELAYRLGQDVITTSNRFDRVANGRPYVFVRSAVANERGSRVTVESSWGRGELDIPLAGDFNVANAIQVLALLLDSGVDFSDACDVIGGVSAPPGRLEPVGLSDVSDLPHVYVDYAHTPAALEAVLRALRLHAAGDLWCVFGCGGDRDKGKRPVMGQVVSRLADHAVVTNDNPRSENPATILAEIDAAMTGDRRVIEDRGAAIAWAIGQARPEDTILIAGKGHEDYQLIGEDRLDFSDCQTARANLEVRARRNAGGAA